MTKDKLRELIYSRVLSATKRKRHLDIIARAAEDLTVAFDIVEICSTPEALRALCPETHAVVPRKANLVMAKKYRALDTPHLHISNLRDAVIYMQAELDAIITAAGAGE